MRNDGPAGTGHLTISEVARLAGVSTRAIRHYHAIGLLPEPARDTSGYRRYDGRDVVALMRVVRLRAVGMPLPQIAERLADTTGDDVSLPTALNALADELDREIGALTATRDQLRELAGSESFAQPARTLTTALQQHGVLGPSDELNDGEVWAAALLDALHPQGMVGILAEAGDLFSDPAAVKRLGVLRQRFRRLSDHADDAEIDALADDVAAVLPRPGQDSPTVDIDMMEKLLTERLNSSKRRFIDHLRDRVEGER